MIDDLFENKLNNYSIESKNDEWLELDIKLTKNNFMKFSFYHFNIYYASVFLISALFSVAAGIDYFFISHSLPPYQHDIMNIQTKNNNRINNGINYSIDTFLNNKKTIIDTSNTSKLIITDSTINKDVNKKGISNSNIIINSQVNNLERSTSDQTNDNLNKKLKPNDNIINTEKQIVDTLINTESKTILIKKDNVIIRDTVIRYKKRKKRKNNN